MQKSRKNYAKNAVSGASAGATSLTIREPLERVVVSSRSKQSLPAVSKQAIPFRTSKYMDKFMNSPPVGIEGNWKRQIAAAMPAEQKNSNALERKQAALMANDAELQFARNFLAKFFREARILEIRQEVETGPARRGLRAYG